MKKAMYFTENWALIEEDGKVYMAEFILRNDFTNCSFEFRQISNRYDEIGDFDKNGIAIVMLDELYGLINDKGEEICTPQYDNIEILFSKYYCAEFYEGDSSIIDVNGNIKISCKEIYNEWSNYAIIGFDDDTYGFIDNECRELHRRRYDDLNYLSDNLLEATIGDTLIIVNYKGEEVFEVKDGRVREGTDGYFDIWVDDKCGKLNSEGKLSIPIKYHSLNCLSDNLMEATIGDTLIIVNYKGEEVFEVKDGSVREGDDGYFDIWVYDKCGKLSPEGKLIIPIVYDSISDLENGVFTAVIECRFVADRILLFDAEGRKIGKEYRKKC